MQLKSFCKSLKRGFSDGTEPNTIVKMISTLELILITFYYQIFLRYLRSTCEEIMCSQVKSSRSFSFPTLVVLMRAAIPVLMTDQYCACASLAYSTYNTPQPSQKAQINLLIRLQRQLPEARCWYDGKSKVNKREYAYSHISGCISKTYDFVPN